MGCECAFTAGTVRQMATNEGINGPMDRCFRHFHVCSSGRSLAKWSIISDISLIVLDFSSTCPNIPREKPAPDRFLQRI